MVNRSENFKVGSSRIVHQIVQTLITKSRLDIYKAGLDARRVIDDQAQGLHAELGQVGDSGCLSGRGQNTQSIPMELARKVVPNAARGAPVGISSGS